MRVLGLVFVVLALPLFIAWLRSGALQRRMAYAALAAMPFVIDAANLDAAVINWSQWPGYAKGAVLTLLDALALALLITHAKTKVSGWIIAPFALYIAAAVLSVAFAGVWMASTFYVFQLLRVLVVLLAVAAIATDLVAVRSLGNGLAAAMILEAAVALYQKMHGAAQAAGTLSHQNLLGMMSHFALFPLAGLMLAGDRSKLVTFGVLAGLVVVALGGSRATIGLTGVGLVLLLVLSTARRPTTRKFQIIGGATVVFALVATIASSTLAARFGRANDITQSDSERTSFDRAAHFMIENHPMGVGANQYVLVANAGGYSQRAGVVWSTGSRSANVHDFYLLTHAETGPIGLACAVLWLVVAMVVAGTHAWRDRRDPRGEIHLGIAVAVLVVSIHNFYEWIFVTSEVQYLFAINLGLTAGMAVAWQRDRRAARRPFRTSEPANGLTTAPAMARASSPGG